MDNAELRQKADAGSAEHQWLLSQAYLVQKRPARASKYFRRALQQGYPEAVLYQLQQWTRTAGEFASFARAQALAAEYPEENYLQSWRWRLGVISGSLDETGEARLLAGQLAANNTEAQRYAALRCALAGRDREARWLLESAADAGDPVAGRVLAENETEGLPGLQPVQSCPLVDEDLGEILRAVPAADAQTLADSPTVLLRPGWLPPLACRLLAVMAAPELQPSLTYEPDTGRQIASPLRTSHSMTFMPWLVDPSVAYLQRLLAAVAGRQPGQCEVLGLLRYQPGQAYQLHYDAFVEDPASRPMFEDGGQRTRTALIYLNDAYTGGETRFEYLDMEVKANTGDLLVFDNVDARGHRHPDSLHAGKAVTTGVKWLLSQWYREGGTLYTRQMNWTLTGDGEAGPV